VSNLDNLDELMSCRLDTGRRAVEPCSIVIFGASGDLTARKLIPALYHLFKDQQMPPAFRIIGFARREKTDDSGAPNLPRWTSPHQTADDAAWQKFSANVHYCMGDITDPAAYQKLEKQLGSFGTPALRSNVLFYLATMPSQFGQVVEHLHSVKLLQRHATEGWQRVVVEKPFGHDLRSAQTLNNELTRFAHEQQIFRIDHYLGKETVQNILMFRFSNAIYERLWNREPVDHVQITVSENTASAGGGYYEAGALRDMVQNHLLQVLRSWRWAAGVARPSPSATKSAAQVHSGLKPDVERTWCAAAFRRRARWQT
jgi:glucose-6-phosphate 1-dehydrogenase